MTTPGLQREFDRLHNARADFIASSSRAPLTYADLDEAEEHEMPRWFYVAVVGFTIAMTIIVGTYAVVQYLIHAQ